MPCCLTLVLSRRKHGPLCGMLPAGWTLITDTGAGPQYYWHENTGTSRWKSPDARSLAAVALIEHLEADSTFGLQAADGAAEWTDDQIKRFFAVWTVQPPEPVRDCAAWSERW